MTFNISEPKAATNDMILSVLEAELKLFKIPLQVIFRAFFAPFCRRTI